MAVVLASSNQDLFVLLGAVAAGALVIQWQSRRLEADPGEIIAECADGSVVGGWHDRVRRRPGRRPEQRARIQSRLPDLKPGSRRTLLTDDLRSGDLCFARVRPGREGEAPWVVDGLDQDRDMTWIRWEFESEDAAHRALELLERRIVQPAHDDSGVRALITEADFDAVQARERLEEQRQDEAAADAPA